MCITSASEILCWVQTHLSSYVASPPDTEVQNYEDNPLSGVMSTLQHFFFLLLADGRRKKEIKKIFCIPNTVEIEVLHNTQGVTENLYF